MRRWTCLRLKISIIIKVYETSASLKKKLWRNPWKLQKNLLKNILEEFLKSSQKKFQNKGKLLKQFLGRVSEEILQRAYLKVALEKFPKYSLESFSIDFMNDFLQWFLKISIVQSWMKFLEDFFKEVFAVKVQLIGRSGLMFPTAKRKKRSSGEITNYKGSFGDFWRCPKEILCEIFEAFDYVEETTRSIF